MSYEVLRGNSDPREIHRSRTHVAGKSLNSKGL